MQKTFTQIRSMGIGVKPKEPVDSIDLPCSAAT